jgi:hypothetical protein
MVAFIPREFKLFWTIAAHARRRVFEVGEINVKCKAGLSLLGVCATTGWGSVPKTLPSIRNRIIGSISDRLMVEPFKSHSKVYSEL